MKITIAQREQKAVIARNRRDYFVDCTVAFSEEEKAIIKERGLRDKFISVGSDIRTGSGIDDYTILNTILRTIPRVMILGGIIAIVVAIFTGGEGSLIMPLFLGALAIFVFRKYSERKFEKSYDDQTLSIGRLMSNPSFSVYASDPADAKNIDSDLRTKLATIKAIITESTTLAPQQTFEL